MRLFGFLLLLTCSLCHAQPPAPPEPKPAATLRIGDGTGATLLVTIKNITEAKGKLCVVLFSDEKGFPDENPTAVSVRVPVAEGIRSETVAVSFVGLKPGTYALSCLHDANNNDKMDTDFFGRPKEKWAMSRNPRPKFRAPRWNEANFTVDAQDATQTLELNR